MQILTDLINTNPTLKDTSISLCKKNVKHAAEHQYASIWTRETETYWWHFEEICKKNSLLYIKPNTKDSNILVLLILNIRF